jgi:hypothetical protein
MEEARVNTRRWKVGSYLAGLLLMIVASLLLARHMKRPFETADRFVSYLRNEQFGEAKAMVDLSDQQEIPDGYWDQFRAHPPALLASPTWLTFINGRMAIKPIIMNPDRPLMEIRYEIDGRHIRVAEITGRLPD